MRKLCVLFLVLVSYPDSLSSQHKDSVGQRELVYPVERIRPSNVLSPTIKLSLDQQYPGWEWTDNYVVFEYTNPDYLKDYPFNPNYISGDFNQDGEQDFTVQINHPDSSGAKFLTVAFVSNKQGFQQYLLGSGSNWGDQYLWASKKGTSYYDFDTQQEAIFPADAITIVIWEKAAISYLFEDGKFVEIITGD